MLRYPNLAAATKDLFVVFFDRTEAAVSPVVRVSSLAALDWTPCPCVAALLQFVTKPM